MKCRLVTAIYWIVLGLWGLFILANIADQYRFINQIAFAVIGLIPFGILPVVRWIRTGEWHIDPR